MYHSGNGLNSCGGVQNFSGIFSCGNLRVGCCSIPRGQSFRSACRRDHRGARWDHGTPAKGNHGQSSHVSLGMAHVASVPKKKFPKKLGVETP